MFQDSDYANLCPKMSIDIGLSISEDTGGWGYTIMYQMNRGELRVQGEWVVGFELQ